jgi:hypothetical protein
MVLGGVMTLQERLAPHLWRHSHTSRDGMYICYGAPDFPEWCSECTWMVPGAPVGDSDSAWDDF